MSARPWPLAMRFSSAEKRLDISFDDGENFSIPYETLRVESPSAEVQGHRPDQKKIVTGKENVGIERADPVGRYAVRLVFDDGHDSGIFTWDYLYALGRQTG